MSNNLPSEYQELEYIESTGTQYINTGIILSPNYKIETEIRWDKEKKNHRQLFGNNAGTYYWGINNAGYYEFSISDYGTIKASTDSFDKIVVSRNSSTGRVSMLVNGINDAYRVNFTTTNVNHSLFKLTEASGYESCCAIKYYEIYNNDKKVCELIPVKRKSDNVIGMYDIIRKQFYTNDGTGEFIAGPRIKEQIKKSEVDWSESMEQIFEYYEVDPVSWKDTKPLNMVKKCKIKLDSTADTLGSATIDINDTLGECYIRVYLVIGQNGGKFRFTLGTFLVQTPSSSYDGKNRNVSMDAYTPLLELKENPPPLGFALLKNENIMRQAYLLVRDNCRAPVVETSLDKLLQDNFVADPNENWLSYVTDLIGQAKYRLYLDENGKILFAPKQKLDELQPVWNYNDDNSSILYPEVSMQHDLYGIPNVVEVVCSTGVHEYTARVVNDDPNSPTSTVNRGREILHRDTEPNLPGYPTEEQIDEYAKNLLEELSSVEYQVTYTHGYCPVRVGDAVRLNYKRAGLDGIKAKVISQSITCENGCSVNETAVFTKKLWN